MMSKFLQCLVSGVHNAAVDYEDHKNYDRQNRQHHWDETILVIFKHSHGIVQYSYFKLK